MVLLWRTLPPSSHGHSRGAKSTQDIPRSKWMQMMQMLCQCSNDILWNKVSILIAVFWGLNKKLCWLQSNHQMDWSFIKLMIMSAEQTFLPSFWGFVNWSCGPQGLFLSDFLSDTKSPCGMYTWKPKANHLWMDVEKLDDEPNHYIH